MGHLIDDDGVRQLARILSRITPVFESAMMQMKAPNRKGAALTIMNIDKEMIFSFTTFVGRPAADKKEKYWNLSIEKSERLLTFPKHLSSFQSKDESKDRYGGAIRTELLLIGVSGFPELWDEAVSLVLAAIGGATTFEQAEYIASISRNPYFKPLFEASPALR